MFRLIVISVLIAFNCAPTSALRGGDDTYIEQHPYQLSLEVFGEHCCGASLIRPNIALTAAHCTALERRPYPNSFTVRAGSTTIRKGGQVAKVVSVCEHPRYSTQHCDYDVSVLKLDRSLSLSHAVQTIPLQPKGVEINIGTLAVVTGWGTLWDRGVLARILHAIHVPKISSENCSATYPRDNITSRMDCYGYSTGDPCPGDSGGPLVVHGKQAGIVSWGQTCNCGKPGVYCKISNPEVTYHINTCIVEFLLIVKHCI